MNKKIKMIELLNMISRGELKNNTKFNIINEDGDMFKCKYSSIYPGHIWVIDNEEVSFNYKIDHLRILSYEVEILEDNTEEIEELQEFDIQGLEISGYSMTQAEYLLEDGVNENRDKINEIIRYIKRKDKNND